MTDAIQETGRQKYQRLRRGKFKRRLRRILVGALALAGVLALIIYYSAKPASRTPNLSTPDSAGVQF